MICPHCKKPIKREHSDDLKKQALSLVKQRYSTRDVESLLERKVSFGTIARWAKEVKE
jgi:transposase-like protein